ncbi:MAG TPA: polyprenyl synthetase family protein [Acidimicrobiales bacterium]|nr:polyprenyl synthetase family protein [Acidimicrobiales bacterium]
MPAPSAAPPDFMAEIGSRTDARLAALLDADRRRWAAVDPDLVAPLESLHRLLRSGGKRLRPVFCHWAFVGLGGDPDDPQVVDGGAALEMLHTFAVIHDDVMDASARRHGEETIHTEFAALHRGRGWRGEDRRFGEGVAILTGDLAFVNSDMLLRGAPRAAWDIFDELRLEVNVGQYLDVLGAARGDASPGLAARICRYKSAKYTVERPLHLGVALAAPELAAGRAGRRGGRGRGGRGRGAGRLQRLRSAPRRGVPAPGRHPRHLRRPRGDRQGGG